MSNDAQIVYKVMRPDCGKDYCISTSIMTNSYGSAADQWGASLTPAIVNDPTFGFAISVTADSVRDFQEIAAMPVLEDGSP